jgi:hypothetical protein
MIFCLGPPKMLIRIRGGRSGIEDYLANGRKAGREFSRDELDERIFLEGNLSITNRIIKGIDSEGDKYLHITLGFKEDEINNGTLKIIVDEFKNFVFAACQPDEYNCYAEAHLPRIKTYLDKATGLVVERKPHIHFIVPSTNLVTGQRLEPLGMVERNIHFIDAFQEHINNKFGLASPKDNPRMIFTGQSEMISRYEGVLFAKQREDLRKLFLSEVLSRRIETWDGFAAMLGEHGQARVVKGKHATYMHFQPDTGKGINLKQVFTPEFIALPTAEKTRRLAPEIEKSYITQNAARRDPEYIFETLREWRDTKSLEIKYINSGNRKLYTKYKDADETGKREILDDLEARFYNQHKENQHAITARLHPVKHRIIPPPHLRGKRVRELSECGLVSVENRSEVLLPNNVRDGLDYGKEKQLRVVRRPDAERRSSGSVVDQSLHELRETVTRSKAGKESRSQLIKKGLDANLLLDSVAKSHGLMIEKYTISKGADGGDRILCGKQNLNVSDFLTREMKLPWDEASKILESVYALQSKEKSTGRISLWSKYIEFRASQAPQLAAQREAIAERKVLIALNHKSERISLKELHRKQREQLFARLSSDPSTLRIEKMLLAKSQADAKAALREQQAADKAALVFPLMPDYESWLAAQEVTAEQAKALARAKKIKAEKEDKSKHFISGRKGFGVIVLSEAHDIRSFTACADRQQGVVLFHSATGALAFTDRGARIDVTLAQDPEAVLAALQLGSQKFGKLTLTGDAEFQKLCVSLAAQHGFLFVDPQLNAAVKAQRDQSSRLSVPKSYTTEAAKPSVQSRPKAAPPDIHVPSVATVLVPEATEAETASAALAQAVQQSLAEIEKFVSSNGLSDFPREQIHNGEFNGPILLKTKHHVLQKTGRTVMLHAEQNIKGIDLASGLDGNGAKTIQYVNGVADIEFDQKQIKKYKSQEPSPGEGRGG